MTGDGGQTSLFGGDAAPAPDDASEGSGTESAGPLSPETDRDGGGTAAEAAGREASFGPSPEAPPGSSPELAVSVSALNAATRRLLEEHYPPLWVAGEVTDWRRPGSGHCYFSLRDEDAQISCVMWRSDARRLPTEPEEGMEVCARGRVSLYEARGTYQLVVRKMEARGEGLWRLAFERLKRKLGEEGLLDDERKRPLPRVPATVAVVTSRTGAALRDVITVVRRRAPWTRLLVSDCRVQGEEAAGEIVRALERVARHGEADLVLLTRGGGSMEDLWSFNEEEVARAVASSPIPVLSAVGHEVDVTIADLVADARAPTPSAAGELAVPDGAALRARLRRLAGGLVSGLRERNRRGEERAERAAERLLGSVARRLERGRARMERLGGRLEALSPLSTLRRGYAVPLDGGGRVIRSVAEFGPDDPFSLRVVDGRVEARVEAAEPLEELGAAAGAGEGDARDG